jgi:endonuclease/exonuclease/phosphatase family metal-dependent hydrolase
MSGDAADAMRLRQMTATTKFIEQHDDCHPTFLVGDMNTGPDSKPIGQLVTQGFVDSYRDKHGPETPKNGNTAMIRLEEGSAEQTPRRRIDFVFGLPAGARVLSVVDSVVGFRNHDAKGFYPSDHLGVMTTWSAGL